jgi:hypothetical protein
MSFISELQRRNVFRVGFAYAVVGWLVAQVADLALESFGAPDWAMKTLLFLILMGFVLALFIAWAYEMTPEGIKRAEDVDPNASITQQTGRKLDRLVIVILFLAVSLLVFDRYRDKPEPTTPTPQNSVAEQVSEASPGVTEQTKPDNKAAEMSDEPSVAVLPFVNMSSDPEQEYFSDGISEEILNVLTHSNSRARISTSLISVNGYRSIICWKAVSGNQATPLGLPHSWSKPIQDSTSGQKPMTENWKMFLLSRMRLPRRSPPTCEPCLPIKRLSLAHRWI